MLFLISSKESFICLKFRALVFWDIELFGLG
jgi:hypothetical protein